MKAKTFLQFVGPSVAIMVLLLAAPLVITFYLSVRNCTLVMEPVRIEEVTPFGKQESWSQRVKLDESGRAVEECRFVGLDYYRRVLGLSTSEASTSSGMEAVAATTAATPPRNEGHGDEFIDALRFTMFYTFATLPFVLVIGLLLALGVNGATKRLKGVFITASLLPFVITPLIAALSIKWLFRDGGLVPDLLAHFGIHVFWMAHAWSARLLIILYGIWQVVPFAFIILYAGLQSVPVDALEAATIDGASRLQKFRYVTLPHLMPLIVFITLIHVMDAYRVFEPVVVLTQGAFTTSVQYLTYYTLLVERNPFKASASAMLTLVGILVLLTPLLVRTWREQRRVF
ncbi:carbohydrate ABC transporter permease [Paraburkholderia sacchari]|uniref:carbohydrate ABC transporter permease n=1 Tax=Paraburkholderia sacchari TaxID=159450 RepID=UPI001BCE7EC2|nr:sugar ABC transporter permease [Paraburkholderia sacchari]